MQNELTEDTMTKETIETQMVMSHRRMEDINYRLDAVEQLSGMDIQFSKSIDDMKKFLLAELTLEEGFLETLKNSWGYYNTKQTLEKLNNRIKALMRIECDESLSGCERDLAAQEGVQVCMIRDRWNIRLEMLENPENTLQELIAADLSTVKEDEEGGNVLCSSIPVCSSFESVV